MIEVVHYTEEDKRLYEYYHSLFRYDDGQLIWKVSPCNRVHIGDTAGTIGAAGYIYVRIDGKGCRIHRVIYHMFHGHCPPKPKVIDHVDNNPLNNRIENLREATPSQNRMNTSKVKNTTSGFMGVSWHKKNKKWAVAIRINGKKKFVGNFDDEIEAALAYNKAALERDPNFSKLNII